MPDPRRSLLDWFQAGLAAAHGGRLVAQTLTDWRPDHPVHLVAIGKAAAAMAGGAARALGETIAQALVIMPDDGDVRNNDLPAHFECLRSAHPVPDTRSLRAGQALLKFIQAAPKTAQWLFLISGGASSLVEVLPAGVTLAELRRVNRELLVSGMDIAQINAERRRYSAIKGGRLATLLGDQPVRALYLSDVPGNDPALIGSGLLATQSPAEILADNSTALQAAAGAAHDAGFPVRIHPERLHGEAAAIGQELAGALMQSPTGVHLWGGECTVALPGNPGKGGRCQHLALSAALTLAGREDCYLLAAGTDGRDGNSDAAGALVDGNTLERGSLAGLDAAAELRRANAGAFLAASGDLIDTGATGTNVNDLFIGLTR